MGAEQTEKAVGFVGAGKMATALARGLLSSEYLRPDRIFAVDSSPEAIEAFVTEIGAQPVDTIAGLFDIADVVILAVKPQHMPDVLSVSRDAVDRERHLLISIAAGIRLSTLTGVLGSDCRVVRVMPNTPCLVGAGASAYALGGAAGIDEAATVEKILSTVGVTMQLDEPLLDAVTGLSGSGPAYVFQVIEALSDGGVRAGLSRDVATRLAAHTVYGAARLVVETGEHPAVLKDAVASPGGTTIAGLHALESGRLRACLMDAVVAATERSRELGESS